ncbi:MAG TPA: tRNA (adenosine(37)-N6)-threonylcarbamoyltransferase complex dimerization subunit type 1 TsaB [Actinomycetota bacterium]|nr:tRNA (adenosine(37)-N6)-threonylcarbamoyltransferase complex dimerization subunit type 1 TsaB [Actinomycetota bacterium]
MLVLGIETSTQQTSVALGTERGAVATMSLAAERAGHELVAPAIQQLLAWSGASLDRVAGVAVGLGPGLFTGMRVGIATAKTLAQVLRVPIVGMASLDILAFDARYARRLVCAAIDAKRGEVFFAFYRPVPGGVARESGFEVASPQHVAGELESRAEDILVVGTAALTYRHELQEAGSKVELASAERSYPAASALVQLAVPRFQREEFDRPSDVQSYYVRKSDAEIAWDQRRRAG